MRKEFNSNQAPNVGAQHSRPLDPLSVDLRGATYRTTLSRSKLYALMKTGDIPSFLVGGRRMFLVEALDAFIMKSAAKGGQHG